MTEVPAGSTNEPLPALLARTGGLDAGQVVTLLAPLADALAALHGRGLAHGAVDAGHVEVDRTGRPVLREAAPGATQKRSPDPATDVRDLARLGLAALHPAAEGSADIRSMLEPIVAEQAAAVPTAGALSATLLTAAVARPLGAAPLVVMAATPGAVGRRWSAVRAPIAAVAAVAVAMAAGTAWGERDRPAAARALPGPTLAVRHSPSPAAAPTPTPTPTPAPAQPHWRAVVTDLERSRAAAVRHGDLAALARLYLPSAAAARTEARALTRLVGRGWRVTGLRPQVLAVRPRVVTPGRAVLRVVDRLPAFRLVDAEGRVIQRQPSRAASAVVLTLARRGGRWLVARVVPAGQPSSAARAASTSP